MIGLSREAPVDSYLVAFVSKTHFDSGSVFEEPNARVECFITNREY